jgi:hypothetical protein
MSPKVRAALITQPLTQAGLREIAALLPEDDAELLAWIEEAYQRAEVDELEKLLYAAAIAGRKLSATLIAEHGLEPFRDGYRFGWLAAHMEGDVTAALLTTSADSTAIMVSAYAMYVAARWWAQHRSGEAFPGKLVVSARNLHSYPDVTPDAAATMGAMAVLMKDAALQRMWGGEGRSAEQMRAENFKRIEGFLEAPLVESFPEKENRGYAGSQPMRRAVERIGRNEPCRCGSGKKYKNCCLKEDEDRLRRSSAVAGKTWDELDQGIEAVTKAQVLQMTLPELVHLNVAYLLDEPQQSALARLAKGDHFDEVVSVFRELGLPERLRANWVFAVREATSAWRRDVVLQLLEAAGDAAPPLENLEGSVRLLLASHDPGEFCAAVEAESLALLKSHDSEELISLVAGLTWSPYRALGIMVARGALLLTEAKHSAWVFDEILSKRADLDLPIDDPVADLLDERASRRDAGQDDAALDEAQAKLEAKAAEVRQVREKLAAMQREIALREKRERRAAAEQTQTAAASRAEPAELREMRRKMETLKALLKERGEERVSLRRELEQLHTDYAALQAAQEAGAPAQEGDEEEEGEALEVHGQQPLRLIAFPKKFQELLASLPPQVGRAVLPLLGRLASGQPAAFKGLVKIRECAEVVRARVAGDYRLLLRFTPEVVEVFDVVDRRDLQKRVKLLGAKGA